MSFTEAVRSVLTQYAKFSGRARRSEFWYWLLFQVVIGVIAWMFDRAIFNVPYGSWFTIIVSLALLLPSLAVAVRRLHDTSRPGWWLLIVLVPVIGSIILLVFYLQDSHPDNAYGPSPKAVSTASVQPEPGPGPAPA